MLLGLVFYLLFTTQATDSALLDESVSNCIAKCDLKFKTACERGCAIAFALTTASNAYPFNPTCTDSCKDAYPGSSEELDACNSGCYAYVAKDQKPQIETTSPNWFTSVLSYFKSMVDKIRSRIAPPQDTTFERQPISKSDDQSIVTRVRIFYFVRPDESETSSNVLLPAAKDKHLSLHADSQHDAKSAMVADNGAQHQIVDHSRAINRDWRIACLLRNAFSDPIRLLFLVTLITLFILLITQLVLCIRRLKRSNHYSYVPLPTYAEAVEVKLPMEANNEDYEDFTKGLKKSDA